MLREENSKNKASVNYITRPCLKVKSSCNFSLFLNCFITIDVNYLASCKITSYFRVSKITFFLFLNMFQRQFSGKNVAAKSVAQCWKP
jgi:hypothetical protein